MQGERRTVTVLFCDVAGSTAMAEQLDPEEWAEIMNDAFQYLSQGQGTAYQARDLKHYMRFQFGAQPMEHHLIEMVRNRGAGPQLAELRLNIDAGGQTGIIATWCWRVQAPGMASREGLTALEYQGRGRLTLRALDWPFVITLPG